jgi:hypothetical protein
VASQVNPGSYPDIRTGVQVQIAAREHPGGRGCLEGREDVEIQAILDSLFRSANLSDPGTPAFVRKPVRTTLAMQGLVTLGPG